MNIYITVTVTITDNLNLTYTYYKLYTVQLLLFLEVSCRQNTSNSQKELDKSVDREIPNASKFQHSRT